MPGLCGSIEIITKEDLNNFKIELLKELKQILLPSTRNNTKDWLKSTEVRKLLGISPNTLMALRSNGKLHSSKIGGIHFYCFSDIEKMLESNL